jgi:cellulose synthase/poly-beta-1,6-N-acetylglucosamine synthase-like glycosyltransferase
MTLRLAFWLSFALIAYVYLGYPVLLALWARFRPRPLAMGENPAGSPGVSIVIAVRNEGGRLAARIDNLLELDYPADRREIIIVSDGSTDDTLEVLRPYRRTVEVIAIEAVGKAAALNAGVARATKEILVFADARQAFATDALTELTAPFRDVRVGAVSGELLLDGESAGRRVATRERRGSRREPASKLARDRRVGPERRCPSQSTIADGVGLYWRIEKRMRRLESAVASTLGATGAIYAMRRSLWTPLPPDTILDDVLAPMRCVLAGYRVVFNERARAFDRAVPDAHAEARRKTRTLAGNYQVLSLEPALLLPWRNVVWAQYWSHKVGRLLVPYALIALMASSIALAQRSIVYSAVLAAQCVFYLLAAYGAWLDFRDSAGRRPIHG